MPARLQRASPPRASPFQIVVVYPAGAMVQAVGTVALPMMMHTIATGDRSGCSGERHKRAHAHVRAAAKRHRADQHDLAVRRLRAAGLPLHDEAHRAGHDVHNQKRGCVHEGIINHGHTFCDILRSYRRQCTQIHQHLAVKSVWAGLVLTMVTRVESPVT